MNVIKELHRNSHIFKKNEVLEDKNEVEEIIDILKEYQIERVFFGHIHGSYNVSSSFEYDGIKFKMVSADFVDFIPQIV